MLGTFSASGVDFGINLNSPPNLSAGDSADVDSVRLEVGSNSFTCFACGVSSEDFADIVLGQVTVVVGSFPTFVSHHPFAGSGILFGSSRNSESRIGLVSQVEQVSLEFVEPVLFSGGEHDWIFQTHLDNLESEGEFAVFVPGVLQVSREMDSATEFGFVVPPSAVDVLSTADVSATGFDVNDGVDTWMLRVGLSGIRAADRVVCGHGSSCSIQEGCGCGCLDAYNIQTT